MTEQVPPYMTKCVHLSMKLMLGNFNSSGGKNQMDRYQMSAMQSRESG